MRIYGINPVIEALRAGRVTALSVSDRAAGGLAAMIAEAERAGVAVLRVAWSDLDRAARGGVHQGLMAEIRDVAKIGV